MAEALARPSAGWLRGFGRAGLLVAEHAGTMGELFWSIVMGVVRLKVSFRDVVQQMYALGVQSLPIALVTASLAGIVTSQQGGYQFTGSIPLYVLGSVVTESMILEMGPVLTAIVLVGRVGARITAELGTMVVTEQIDAYHALGRDPVAILVAPRVIAGVLVVPLLVGLADLTGMLVGMFAAKLTTGLGYESFLYGARLFWHSWDLVYSLTKALAFGFAIPFISTHMGLRSKGGAEGVGRQTTASVVFMLMTVLILDAMFPPLMLQ